MPQLQDYVHAFCKESDVARISVHLCLALFLLPKSHYSQIACEAMAIVFCYEASPLLSAQYETHGAS